MGVSRQVFSREVLIRSICSDEEKNALSSLVRTIDNIYVVRSESWKEIRAQIDKEKYPTLYEGMLQLEKNAFHERSFVNEQILDEDHGIDLLQKIIEIQAVIGHANGHSKLLCRFYIMALLDVSESSHLIQI